MSSVSEKLQELGLHLHDNPCMALAGGRAKPSCATKHRRDPSPQFIACRRSGPSWGLSRSEAFKQFGGRLIRASISAMSKIAMLRQIGGRKSRQPDKRSRPARTTAAILQAAGNPVTTSPPVSGGRASEPKLTARRCVRLRPVIAHCSLCGSPAHEVHLIGDRRARCVQCCPVCSHAQPPAQASVTRPRAGYPSA